ncbi:hypothetical protein PC117_g26015 [Phytophthora cactorum]|uniref:Uncharacterized protein n=1 Tax=Phytophthora cactorum TaxID=29920 RepID=A0A8T1AKT5_9STRA|nr:hypothetical protein PC117_g26015 [Phytophthora cactorum]
MAAATPIGQVAMLWQLTNLPLSTGSHKARSLTELNYNRGLALRF